MPPEPSTLACYFATLVRIGDKECIFGMQLDRTEECEMEAKFLQAQKKWKH